MYHINDVLSIFMPYVITVIIIFRNEFYPLIF